MYKPLVLEAICNKSLNEVTLIKASHATDFSLIAPNGTYVEHGRTKFAGTVSLCIHGDITPLNILVGKKHKITIEQIEG